MQHVSEADISQRSVVELLLLAPRLLATCPLDPPDSCLGELASISSDDMRGKVGRKSYVEY